MDALACNYNPDATNDDGSCVCEDLWIVQVCLNDADNDDVCDELEVQGCTASNACNYNLSRPTKMTAATSVHVRERRNHCVRMEIDTVAVHEEGDLAA